MNCLGGVGCLGKGIDLGSRLARGVNTTIFYKGELTISGIRYSTIVTLLGIT